MVAGLDRNEQRALTATAAQLDALGHQASQKTSAKAAAIRGSPGVLGGGVGGAHWMKLKITFVFITSGQSTR